MMPLAPFEERLLQVIGHVSRRSGGLPARTAAICSELGHANSVRTIQWYLQRLETRGHISRVSKKTGWRIQGAPDLLNGAIEQRDSTRLLMDRLGCNETTARRALAKHRLN